MNEQFESVLGEIGITIEKYNAAKQRPVITSIGAMTIEKFAKEILNRAGGRITKHPIIFEAVHNLGDFKEMVEKYANDNQLTVKTGKVSIDIPPEFKDLVLNMDMTPKNMRDEVYFLTNPDETISKVGGAAYLRVMQMKDDEAAALARKVIPEYHPKEKVGVFKKLNNGVEETIFNLYHPPKWKNYNYKDWKKLYGDGPPKLFKKLVEHLFPIPVEREFFYDWLHDSLFARSYTFLVLCGAPGTGKNRLKLVMRALHGHKNTVDGKKSSLAEKFNAQFVKGTLVWFDELHYDVDMENTMKELQNDTISIERKGIDATQATRIYSSIVISNNKPRDNYIAFDARKFAPLNVTGRRLEKSMTSEEIDELTQKVERDEDIDVKFIAQIAKWLKRRGNTGKWPHLEYRGPMFWKLAHTSMSRWQKKAAQFALDVKNQNSNNGWNAGMKSFKWSECHRKLSKRDTDRYGMPDYTSVRSFFDTFRNEVGKPAFKTRAIKGDLMGDFYVEPLMAVTIATEQSIMAESEKANGRKEKDTDYL